MQASTSVDLSIYAVLGVSSVRAPTLSPCHVSASGGPAFLPTAKGNPRVPSAHRVASSVSGLSFWKGSVELPLDASNPLVFKPANLAFD